MKTIVFTNIVISSFITSALMYLSFKNRSTGEFCIDPLGDPDVCSLDWATLLPTAFYIFATWFIILSVFAFLARLVFKLINKLSNSPSP